MRHDPTAAKECAVPDRRAAISAARKDAHAFRGAFLDKYAHLERSLVPVLLLAAVMPEYKAVTGKSLHLFGQKIAAFHKLAEAAGPLKFRLAKIIVQLDDLARYDEIRTLMSHAAVEIALTEHNETVFVFHMIRLTKSRADQITLTVGRDEAAALASRVGAVINLIVGELNVIGKAYRGSIACLPASRPYLPE